MKQTLRISVHDLVEFVCRSGDLELTVFGSVHPVEAIRIHQKIQRSRPGDYAQEVTVSHVIETDLFILKIGGRIDGVFRHNGSRVIDEIKTTTRDPDSYRDTENRLHWAQAKSYAYIFAVDNDLDAIDVQLTYYQADTGKTVEIRRSFERDDLESFFRSLVERYLSWAETLAKWRLIRDESIRVLPFPYPDYRPGQRAMAGDVYRTIRDRARLILQAPTGIGKTMAALFPALKAISGGLTGTIFYLTARTTGRAAAENALKTLRGSGLRLKSLTLTAKDKVCFSPGSPCNGEECEYARGYYDRLGDAIADAFMSDAFTSDVIGELAANHQVCPFEFSLDLAIFVDCIICDYNYAFDPRVYLRRFFQEGNGDFTFLIDEAHNLVDRAREMFSSELSKEPILSVRRALKDQLPGLYRQSVSINAWMVKARKRCETEGNPLADADAPEALFPLLRRFVDMAERWLARNIGTPFREELLDVYFTMGGFLRVAERYDKCYATLYEKHDNDVTVRLFCLDPGPQLGEALERCRAAVFFSATMMPAGYFRTIFGCDESTPAMVLPSPFPQENLCVLVAGTVSTLYKNRDRTKTDAARALASLVNHRTGNYLLYFPSYEYMASVHELFTEMNPGVDTIIQTRGMSESERGDFLDRFSRDNERTLAGFAVMGGVFSESVDLVGDCLTGSAIVGVGLPGVCLERELIRDYFMRHGGSGFEFAYMYPGINKVFQAAGRVIRSESDRGVVLLVDERFMQARYRELFPEEWSPIAVRSENDIGEELERFWGGG